MTIISSKHSLLLPLFLSLLFITPVQARDNSEALLELFQRIDALGKEIRTLRGENEHLQHTIEKLKKAQKDGFLGVDQRVDGLSKRVNLIAKKQTTATKTAIKKPAKPTTPAQTASKKPVKPTASKVNTANKPKAPVQTNGKKPPAKTPTQQKTQEKPKAKLIGKAEVVKTPAQKIRAPTQEEKTTYNQAYKRVNAQPIAAIQAFRNL